MTTAAVLFDLDGTLLDTLEDIATAVNRALVSLGFPLHPKNAYRYFVGEGIGELARRALPENRRGAEDVKACLAAISREYGGGLLVKTKPYPGIPELLAALVKRNIRCAVVSNKPHELTLRSVGTLFPGVVFGAVLGERKGVPPKPDPKVALEAVSTLGAAPPECVYVGDSGIDMKTAAAAGMYPVGALWGFRDKEELIANGAKALIKHPMDLLKLLDKKFEDIAGILGTEGDMLRSLLEDKKQERKL
jgi:phosphoglycolate phosphatase